ncbi:MAG: FkbM family methyltransferase [Pseudotabrizicola sp.]|uniref:FkbM family methyltransferase n=1 Tax=Pseudotabrizicola sp. TaxID=2939647 RepID=UPI002731FD51|nr:FkbM family methyltransferase [Pseudotabrizicola sp.]MDP2080451.1 FkbM family methyltransferase [Pseudotabrizicola sp.]MDZ7573704.1 FkbM family methyltransferase [Pseudotabrizicola sp.]
MPNLPWWKLSREIGRIRGKIKFALLGLDRSRTTIFYQGLQVPIARSGMRSDVVMALARNYYETPEIKGLRACIRPGDRVLELGSGLGIVTALIGRACGPDGFVLSFEANPDLISDTRKFLKDHNIENVELCHAVLVPHADVDETREFHISGSFASNSMLDINDGRSVRTISVPARSVLDVVVEFKPTVLMCDIEGGEAELIPALEAGGLRAVVIELHPHILSAEQIESIYTSLARYGLQPSPCQLGGTVVMFRRDLN